MYRASYTVMLEQADFLTQTDENSNNLQDVVQSSRLSNKYLLTLKHLA